MGTLSNELNKIKSDVDLSRKEINEKYEKQNMPLKSSMTSRQLPQAIRDIPDRIDTESDATPEDIWKDKTVIVNDEKIVGTLEIAPEHLMFGKIIHGIIGTATEDGDATPTDILENKAAYVKGEKVIGTVKGRERTVYVPSTMEQTIPRNIFLKEEQIIRGDKNLIPSNIKKGVSIFNVIGTLEERVDISGTTFDPITASKFDIVENTFAYTESFNKINGKLSDKRGDTITKGVVKSSDKSNVYVSPAVQGAYNYDSKLKVNQHDIGKILDIDPNKIDDGYEILGIKGTKFPVLNQELEDGTIINKPVYNPEWLDKDRIQPPHDKDPVLLDYDTDGDGKTDINQTDGTSDIPILNIDTNNDRVPDVNITKPGKDKPVINIDTNGDFKPDINIDANADGIPDLNIDIDGDGEPEYNIDTNGDNIPDLNIIPPNNIHMDDDGNVTIDEGTFVRNETKNKGDTEPSYNIDTTGKGDTTLNVKNTSASIQEVFGDIKFFLDLDKDGVADTNLLVNVKDFDDYDPSKYSYKSRSSAIAPAAKGIFRKKDLVFGFSVDMSGVDMSGDWTKNLSYTREDATIEYQGEKLSLVNYSDDNEKPGDHDGPTMSGDKLYSEGEEIFNPNDGNVVKYDFSKTGFLSFVLRRDAHFDDKRFDVKKAWTAGQNGFPHTPIIYVGEPRTPFVYHTKGWGSFAAVNRFTEQEVQPGGTIWHQGMGSGTNAPFHKVYKPGTSPINPQRQDVDDTQSGGFFNPTHRIAFKVTKRGPQLTYQFSDVLDKDTANPRYEPKYKSIIGLNQDRYFGKWNVWPQPIRVGVGSYGSRNPVLSNVVLKDLDTNTIIDFDKLGVSRVNEIINQNYIFNYRSNSKADGTGNVDLINWKAEEHEGHVCLVYDKLNYKDQIHSYNVSTFGPTLGVNFEYSGILYSRDPYDCGEIAIVLQLIKGEPNKMPNKDDKKEDDPEKTPYEPKDEDKDDEDGDGDQGDESQDNKEDLYEESKKDENGNERELNKDTDGDGIPDINIDSNDDGFPDWNIDDNGDDIPDRKIVTPIDEAEPGDLNIDTDGDGIPDVNIDIDDDGIPDVNIDTDGDFIPDENIDTDGDGVADTNLNDRTDGLPGLLNQDTDGDGEPDLNIDADGDGKADWNIDTDGDGIPDKNLLNQDTNGDGIPDLNVDTDGDGIPDYNIDYDGDGIPDCNIVSEDNIELNQYGKPQLKPDVNSDNITNIDVDGDGEPDWNIDTNGDGIPDKKILNQDTDGDGKPDLNIDSDKDGKPEYNIDHNDDGKPDTNIIPKEDISVDDDGNIKVDDKNITNLDTDDDGEPDHNLDYDEDGEPEANVLPENESNKKYFLLEGHPYKGSAASYGENSSHSQLGVRDSHERGRGDTIFEGDKLSKPGKWRNQKMFIFMRRAKSFKDGQYLEVFMSDFFTESFDDFLNDLLTRGQDAPILDDNAKLPEIDNEELQNTEMPSWVDMPDSQLQDESIDGHKFANIIDFSKANSSNIKDLVGKGFTFSCCSCDQHNNIRFVDRAPKNDYSPELIPPPFIEVDIRNCNNGTDVVNAIMRDSGNYFDAAKIVGDLAVGLTESGIQQHYTKLQAKGDKLLVYDIRNSGDDRFAEPTPDLEKDWGVIKSGIIITEPFPPDQNDFLVSFQDIARDKTDKIYHDLIPWNSIGLLNNNQVGVFVCSINDARILYMSSKSTINKYGREYNQFTTAYRKTILPIHGFTSIGWSKKSFAYQHAGDAIPEGLYRSHNEDPQFLGPLDVNGNWITPKIENGMFVKQFEDIGEGPKRLNMSLTRGITQDEDFAIGMFIDSVNKSGVDDGHIGLCIYEHGQDKRDDKVKNPINEDKDKDGIPDTNLDNNNDGKPDTNIYNPDTKQYTNVDMDGDGKPDTNIDVNGDGIPDYNIDTDGDGKPDCNIVPKEDISIDEDGNPHVKTDNLYNIDSDGDGKPDVNVDNNGDGKADYNKVSKDKIKINPDGTIGDIDKNSMYDKDSNGDGIADTDLDTDGDGVADTNVDTNGDGKADHNIDRDKDGKGDVNTNNNTNQDTDGDNIPNKNIDTNGDGKADVNIDNGDGDNYLNKDTNGDGKPDLNIDTDGDGKPDINIDTDGDGRPDKNIDTDYDGLPDEGVGEEDKNNPGAIPEDNINSIDRDTITEDPLKDPSILDDPNREPDDDNPIFDNMNDFFKEDDKTNPVPPRIDEDIEDEEDEEQEGFVGSGGVADNAPIIDANPFMQFAYVDYYLPCYGPLVQWRLPEYYPVNLLNYAIRDEEGYITTFMYDPSIDYSSVKLIFGSNPTFNASSSDEKKKRIMIFDKEVSWTDAKNFCEFVGGNLFMPKTMNQNLFLKQVLERYNLDSMWLGATDEEQEGVWKWIDGTNVAPLDNWNIDEPNNLNGNEHYMVMFCGAGIAPGKWNDYPNDHYAKFVCEIPIEKDYIEAPQLSPFLQACIFVFVRLARKQEHSKKLYHYGLRNYFDIDKFRADLDKNKPILDHFDERMARQICNYTSKEWKDYYTFWPGEMPDMQKFGTPYHIERAFELYKRMGKAIQDNGEVNSYRGRSLSTGQLFPYSPTIQYDDGTTCLQLYIADLYITYDQLQHIALAVYMDFNAYMPYYFPFSGFTEIEIDMPQHDLNYEQTGEAKTMKIIEWVYMPYFPEPIRQKMIKVCGDFFERLTQKVKEVTGIEYKESEQVGNTYENLNRYTTEEKLKIAKCIHDFILADSYYDPYFGKEGLGVDAIFSQNQFSAMSRYSDVSEVQDLSKNGRTVCAGYAQAFKYCCNMYGIVAHMATGIGVRGQARDGLHAWNRINYLPAAFLESQELTDLYDINRIKEVLQQYDGDNINLYYPTYDDGLKKFAYETPEHFVAKVKYQDSIRQMYNTEWYEVDVCWDDSGTGDQCGNEQGIKWNYFNIQSSFLSRTSQRLWGKYDYTDVVNDIADEEIRANKTYEYWQNEVDNSDGNAWVRLEAFANYPGQLYHEDEEYLSDGTEYKYLGGTLYEW